MSLKTIFGLLLAFSLLALNVNGLKWQGAGAINNTVISKIWDHINANLTRAFSTMDTTTRSNFGKTLSLSMNQLWSPAWNVVIIQCNKGHDTILYGYAFRDQWMWYNGIADLNNLSRELCVIVWKDYNCDTWTYFPRYDQTPTFSTAQLDSIKAEVAKITKQQLQTDIWGVAHTLVESIAAKSEFQSGGYSIIMSQFGSKFSFGYICMVPGHYFDTSYASGYGNGIIAADQLGGFFLFQTRLGGPR